MGFCGPFCFLSEDDSVSNLLSAVESFPERRDRGVGADPVLCWVCTPGADE